MNPSIRRAAVLALAVVSLACGGGGGASSPTEPPRPTGKQFQFTVGATSAVLEGSLLEAMISFDGREVSRVAWDRAGGSCQILCTLPANVQGIANGTHTVTFTVVRQTRQVVDYFVTCNGIITDPATGGRDVVNAPQQRARLREGQSVTFSIRF